MPGTRRQGGESQAMEQIINTAQGVLDPEFFTEDALCFFGPKRADAIRLGGVGQETLFEIEHRLAQLAEKMEKRQYQKVPRRDPRGGPD